MHHCPGSVPEVRGVSLYPMRLTVWSFLLCVAGTALVSSVASSDRVHLVDGQGHSCAYENDLSGMTHGTISSLDLDDNEIGLQFNTPPLRHVPYWNMDQWSIFK